MADRDGNFVRDLKQTDFQVFEDGKPQSITTFALVDIPNGAGDHPAPSLAVRPVEPDVRSNEQAFNGRIYVMVVDDLHTGFGRTGRVRAAARQFVEQHLGANDLMAIVHTAGSSEGNQEFTGNRRLLVAAIDRTLGRKLDSATITRNQESSRLANTRGSGRSRDRYGRNGAHVERPPVTRHAARCGPVVCARAGTAQGHPVRERRDRLRHHQLGRQPERIDHHGVNARRGCRGRQGQCRHLRHRSPRTDQPRRRHDSSVELSRRHEARYRLVGAAAGTAPGAEQPARPVRRDRRVCRGQRE